MQGETFETPDVLLAAKRKSPLEVEQKGLPARRRVSQEAHTAFICPI
jgi:hypothetical protein